MKFLCTLLFCVAMLSAGAQDSTSRYTILNVEAGASFVGIGGVRPAKVPSISLNSGIAVWPSLIIRFARVTPHWNYGFRTEVTLWGTKTDINYTDPNGAPLINTSSILFYAAPALSVAPHVSRNLIKTKDRTLAVGAYVGAAFSPHEQSQSIANSNQNFYFDPSIAFQYGVEVLYRYWVRPNLAFSASTGFQRNMARYNENRDLGFNLNTLPITAGISFRL